VVETVVADDDPLVQPIADAATTEHQDPAVRLTGRRVTATHERRLERRLGRASERFERASIDPQLPAGQHAGVEHEQAVGQIGREVATRPGQAEGLALDQGDCSGRG
jgi:hypothetical protein